MIFLPPLSEFASISYTGDYRVLTSFHQELEKEHIVCWVYGFKELEHQGEEKQR